jgi:hypothetical protein
MSNKIPDFATKEFIAAKKDFVDAKISEAKFKIILWYFIFWATQLGAMLAFVKFMK